MTIQGMFELTTYFLDMMGKCGLVARHPQDRYDHPQCEHPEDGNNIDQDRNNLIYLEDALARISHYLPKFVPMDCKNCKHTNCNRKRDIGVCSEYEV